MKRHPLDIASLVVGLVLAGVGTVFLTTDVDVSLTSLRWVWPVVLLAAGIGVLFTARSDDG